MGERRARSPTRVFFVPPFRHLSCTLCDDNFKELNLPCGHTFCRACVVRWFERQRTCPECRVNIPPGAPLPTNWTVRAQVDELRVRCRFGVKEEGDGWVADEACCPARLSLDGAAAHEAACGFATTTCPFAGCGVELRRSDVASHNEATLRAHLDGERTARLAGEIRLAAVEASAASTRADLDGGRVARLAEVTALTASAAAATSRVALLEARLAALEQRLPARLGAPLPQPVAPLPQPVASLPVPSMPLDGWAARHTIQTGDDFPVRCCAFSPVGTSVCVGLQNRALKLFDATSGDHRHTLERHKDRVACCAFSPDGSIIVSGSHDNTVKLWCVASGALIRTLQDHTGWVSCGAFSPDGRSICSGSGDKLLKLWNASTGERNAR